MRKPAILIALLLTAAAVSLQAQSVYSDFYVIPAAGHTPGVNGSVWMSDVAVRNISNTPMTLQLVFVEGGEANFDNVFPLVSAASTTGSALVPANGSVLLRDVLNGYRGMSAVTGAILIGADRPFAVTSRSYSMSPSGNTIGQTVLPARDFLDNVGMTTDNTVLAYLPGLISNAQFRTNLGFVAGSSNSGPMTIAVSLRNADGTIVGTRRFTIAAGNFTQLQFSASSVAPGQFDIGSAEFQIVSGNGALVPYASVIDNATADAVFVLGQFPGRTGGTAPLSFGKSAQPSLFREIFDRTRQ